MLRACGLSACQAQRQIANCLDTTRHKLLSLLSTAGRLARSRRLELLPNRQLVPLQPAVCPTLWHGWLWKQHEAMHIQAPVATIHNYAPRYCRHLRRAAGMVTPSHKA
jgi:G:T-mismatch repair DNA endonuclease (very short patch repair protein)